MPSHRRRPDVTPQVLALLARAQHGDRDAFAQLYLMFREPVTLYVAVRLRGRDRDAIPDLVQEAFTGALADLNAALLDVRGWFIWHAAKACNQHDWSRRRYVRAAYAVRDHEPAPAASAVAVPPARLGRITFAHAMARLTAAQRRAIQLRYVDGYPRDATARLMDRSTDAVRDLERRGLRHLQAALAAAPVTA
ncbi:MAG TPA: sigma-70 family RNA polymerase sigma factor [Actinoplanes sp.]|nr:sigma-70 family RNA polymerase sigma factor [Actinoplanes sp.]